MNGHRKPNATALISPDGLFTITDEQGMKALASFEWSEKNVPWEPPPRWADDPHAIRVLRLARLAGHLGGAMGLSEDGCIDLYMRSVHFRTYVETLLGVMDQTRRAWNAGLS